MTKRIPWKESIERITKEEATKLLSRPHPSQRKIDPVHVGMLARAMDLGKWDPTDPNDPIQIDRKGCVIDGHHRLTAFIASSLRVLYVRVRRGCDPDLFKRINQGTKARGPAQANPGRSLVKRDSSRVKYLLMIEQGLPNMKLSNPEFLHYADGRFRESLTWAGEALRSEQRPLLAPIVASIMYVRMADKKFGEELAEAWRTGSGLSPRLQKFRDAIFRGDAISYEGSGNHQTSALRALVEFLHYAMLMHLKHDPKRVVVSQAGLKHFSDLIGDGAYSRWAPSEEPVETEPALLQ